MLTDKSPEKAAASGAPAARTYELHDAERITIRDNSPELLDAEVVWAPGAVKPFVHAHPQQDEHFELHAGQMTVRIDDGERTLRAGDTLDVPRGTMHAMWNSGDEPARATWQVRPALRTEELWRAIDEARRRPGATGAHGMLTPSAAAPILLAHRAEMRLAIPAPAQGVALRALSLLGRVRRR